MKKLPLILVVLLVMVMGVATFGEKQLGTQVVHAYVYGAWWFSLLWALFAVSGLFFLWKQKQQRSISLLLLHFSILFIVMGGIITHVFSQEGRIALKKGLPVTEITSEETSTALPFAITLDTFYVVYYPGTNTPADYVSRFHVSEDMRKEAGQVSMNKIFNYKGYRFFQTSFEKQKQTVTLSVNKDVWGIRFTYTGFSLFILAGLFVLLSPKGKYRKLLAHPLIKKTMLILLVLSSGSALANTLTRDSLSVNKKQAEAFGNLWMLHQGRIKPVAAFANEFTCKMTGRSSFGYLDANQFLMGCLLFPEKWQQVALFDIDDPTLQKLLNATEEKAAVMDFYDSHGNYKLQAYLPPKSSAVKKNAHQKEAERLDEKIRLMYLLQNGMLLAIYPQKTDGYVQWFTSIQPLSGQITDTNELFIRTFLQNYKQAILHDFEKEAFKEIDRLCQFQYQQAGNVLPSVNQRKAEFFYLKADVIQWLFKVNLLMGIFSFMLFFRPRKCLQICFYVILWVSFFILTGNLALRTYISGYLPLSNGYETMMAMAWCAILIAILFSKKIRLLMPFGFLFSGFMLLVAYLGAKNPPITPLMPVLASPLLSFHVSVMMLAYTLLAFIALNSMVALLQIFFCKDSKRLSHKLSSHKIYSLICLYPAVFFLGAGIIIGAIWANVSWGRYWGWDPKEIWALITLLVYMLLLCEKHIKIFSHVFFFHISALLAFGTVLMTYFGVNIFLGGMHSYGVSSGIRPMLIVILLFAICLIGLLFMLYLKVKKIMTQ